MNERSFIVKSTYGGAVAARAFSRMQPTSVVFSLSVGRWTLSVGRLLHKAANANAPART
jgi:hypothetical protein